MSLRSRLGFTTEPLYLMDGSAFIFRSFYAFRNMTRSDGFPTNALYMVARMVLKLIREEKPTHFGFILDGKGKNFRHTIFPEYKSQRSATPEPLVQQLAPLRKLLEILGVPVLVSENCEADDCIASLAHRFRDSRPVIVIGADKDLKQCLHPQVVLWDPAAKDEKITTLQSFENETGMAPSSWPDFQALVGDSSDNIPGVPKVGEKTALGLIQEFKTLEGLFDHLPAVPPKIRSKLKGQRDHAMLYRELTRLQRTACPSTEEAELTVREIAMEPVLEFMAEYELRALAREVESMARTGLLVRIKAASPLAAKPTDRPATYAPEKKSDAATPAATQGSLLAGNTSGTQLLTPPACAATEQGSLFAAASPLSEPAFPSVSSPAVFSVEALGLSKSGKDVPVALVPLESLGSSGLLVAANGKEQIYSSSLEALAAALAELNEPIAVPDAKTVRKRAPALGLLPPERWFDLSLAAYLLSPEDRGYSLAQVATRWGEQSASPYRIDTHPGLLLLDLRRFMAEQLAGAGLLPVFIGLELPLAPVLAAMEERGVAIDPAAFTSFLNEVQIELERLNMRIHDLAGRPFNVRSSQQLSDVLFGALHLPRAGKTRGGAASTSQDALEKLGGKHPIIEAILEFRKLEKLRSTYLEPLPKLADKESRVHTTFNQTATATGRLSSSNPNLQNIPVRGPLGSRMRACFVAAPGKLLISADYSQIELRVLAHLSGDPTLLEAFRNNQDIHARTAGLLFDVPLDEVTPDMRRSAKTINFGIVYGMGAQKLAQEMHISVKEAKAFIERYFERLSKLKALYDTIEEDAKQHGYVSTITGRRRLTPDILSANNQLRSQARRQAINTRIQGSAADIIKMAMLAVENDPELKRLEARLLLQIHDELLLEVPEANAKAAGKRLAALMSEVKPGGSQLSVPLAVDWGAGRSWDKAH